MKIHKDIIDRLKQWKDSTNRKPILLKGIRKFLYHIIRCGARTREYEDALLWLEEAGLIYCIFNVAKPGLPLSAYRL